MSTNREQVLRKLGLPKDTQLGLLDIASLTKTPYKALREVFDRGVGAWKTNPSSVRVQGSFKKDPNLKKYPRAKRLGPEQWAYARVYAFVNKTAKVFYGADRDIAVKYGLLKKSKQD